MSNASTPMPGAEMSRFAMFPVTNGVTTLLPPPPGYVVDFDNPQRNNIMVNYVVIIIGTVLSTLFMAQRLYTKIFIVNGLQIEDYMLILAFAMSYVIQAMSLWGLAAGALGIHVWELPIERFEGIFMIGMYIAGVLFTPTAAIAKLALSIFYLRLSPQKWFRYAVWANIVVIASYGTAITLALLFACNPVAKSWTLTMPGTCLDTTPLYIATCVTNSFTDVVLFLLPIPTVMGLKMPLSQRVGVIAMFSVGLILIIFSIVRASLLPTLSSMDTSWVLAKVGIWSSLETSLTIICATVSTLKKFLRHISPRLVGSSWASKDRGSGRQTPSANNLNTIGGSNHHSRKKYAKFGEGKDPERAVELSSWNGRDDLIAGQTMTTTVGRDESRRSDDDASEKAIVTTKTIVVERDIRL